MSDVAATNCGCGCENNGCGNTNNNNGCNSILWIILLLCAVAMEMESAVETVLAATTAVS